MCSIVLSILDIHIGNIHLCIFLADLEEILTEGILEKRKNKFLPDGKY